MGKHSIAWAGLGLILLAGPVQAADSWGVAGEKEASFKAMVVDIRCELTGDCPAGCGAGKRQLGLKTADGKLVLAIKNGGPFTGAAADLLPYCGKEIGVDGVFSSGHGSTVFAVQYVKPAGAADFAYTNGFVEDWAKRNKVAADAPEAEEWYRNDAKIKDIVGRQGKLGVKE